MSALALFASGSRQAAAAGELLTSFERPEGCFGLKTGVGVDFAFNELRYTCQNAFTGQQSNTIFRTDREGSLVGKIYNFTYSGQALPLEAIDNMQGIPYGVGRFPTGAGSGICAVWRLTVSVSGQSPGEALGAGLLRFTFDGPGDCDFTTGNYAPAIAYDYPTDTIYVSGGGSIIRHFNLDGTPAPNDPIDLAGVSPGVCTGACRSSGLLVGADGSLLSATGTSGQLVRIDPVNHTLMNVYTSGAGRDWDLACGPMYSKPDGSIVPGLYSADFYSYQIKLIQAPGGICEPIDYAVANLAPLPALPPSSEVGQALYGTLVGQAAAFNPPAANFNSEVTVELSVETSGPDHIFRLVSLAGDRCWSKDGPDPLTGVPCEEGNDPNADECFVLERFAIRQPVQCGRPSGDMCNAPGDLYTTADCEAPSDGGIICFDAVDNEPDGLIDFADPDCVSDIDALTFHFPAANQFVWFQRYWSLECLEPGTVNIVLSAHIRHSLFYFAASDSNPVDDEQTQHLSIACTTS